jgi:hypothetical protein
VGNLADTQMQEITTHDKRNNRPRWVRWRGNLAPRNLSWRGAWDDRSCASQHPHDLLKSDRFSEVILFAAAVAVVITLLLIAVVLLRAPGF